MDISTENDDFYQDEDGTFIAVDYDDDETWDNDDDDTKSGDNDHDMILEDYQTDDKFIVTDDGDVGYGDDIDDDFEDHNERNMVYLSNAYSNTTSRNSIDFDCTQYIMDTPIGIDTPISIDTPVANTISDNNSNFNPFNIKWGSLSLNKSNNSSRPEMVEMGTYTTTINNLNTIKSEDMNDNNENQGEMARDDNNIDSNNININTNKIEKC